MLSLVVGVLNVDAASLNLAWIGPTTNADGTPLRDLAGYRVYLGTAVAPPCPGAPFGEVASSTPAPTTGETIAYQLLGLTPGVSYVARITAIDTAGNESSCTGPASGVASTDLGVSPAGSVNVGSTTVGTAVDTSFTVRNTTASSLTGTASVGAPFSVVSGRSFSLASGASQAVIVRLLSSTTGTVASNVTFSANGDTVSRTVTGSVVSAAAPPPPPLTLAVTRNGTGSGTVTSAPAGIACGTDCSETATAGTRLTLTAAAAAGSTFAGWTGGGCSGVAACTVTVNVNTTVAATFNTSPAPSAPVPVASTLSPSSADAGGPGLTLTVSGSGFVSSSVVRWNGANRATTFVSGSQLRASIPSTDVASGQSVPVDVVTPTPGGGTSTARTFTVNATAVAVATDIVIDNAAPGVQDPRGGRTFTGTWCLARASSEYGSSSLRSCGRKHDSYRWTPTIAVRGTYDVYVWIPKGASWSMSVPIEVRHANGGTTRTFNEWRAPGNWVLHGRYTFNAGTAGYVETRDSRGTAVADAVRFVPR